MGTLCAFDTKPAELDINNFELFNLFAKLITHELEIEEANVIRETALKESIQTSEARARFMSILGHDLRGPLNTIVMAANIQKTAKLDEEKSKEFSDKILRAAKRMQHLIDDLLDTTRAVQGDKISIFKKPADLREICEHIIEEFRISNPDNKIEFYAEENCHGDWDERRLGQVLSNLLSNAIHYGDPSQPIKVNLIEECDKILLQVNNRGRLISPERLQNLFRPFWRGARKRANSSGLGLGLYIVKQIVEAHDGSISVESNREYGTTFTATFEKSEKSEKSEN